MKKELRLKILGKFNGRCAYCGCDLNYRNLQVDHIVPLFRGSDDRELSLYGVKRGSNDISNLNPCCASCNSSKSTFTLENWRNEIAKKHKKLLRDNSSYRILNRFGLIKTVGNVQFYFEKIK